MTDRSVQRLWWIDLKTGDQTLVVPGPASHPRWSSSGQLAFLAPDAEGNAQIFIHTWATGATLQVSRQPQGADISSGLPMGSSWHSRCSYPYGDDGPDWSTSFQLYAAAGYVVLYANPRGSTSYGEAFAEQIAHDFPGHDYDDLMSVVDEAVSRGVADKSRLFVTGGSAGGTMTAWIVGKTDRFKAAVAEKPQINRLSQILSNDQYTAASALFGGMPWDMPQTFWAHSPLSLVGNVKTPTMLLVGEGDRRTPLGESEQFYDALKLRGISTELVVIPNAGHESLGARPTQLAAEIALTLNWFRAHEP